jgi:hypothetical protein
MTKSQPEAAKGSPEKNQKHYTADQKHRGHEPFLMTSKSRVKANQQTQPAPNQSHQDAGDSRNKMGASCWWLVGWAAKQNSHEEQNSQNDYTDLAQQPDNLIAVVHRTSGFARLDTSLLLQPRNQFHQFPKRLYMLQF